MKQKHKSALLLIGLAYLSFISIGLPDGLFGVAWPSIRAFFALPLDALGPLLVMFTVGYLLSSFSSGKILRRMTVGTSLAVSCSATAVSLLIYALAPSWWIMVAFGLLAGLGAGAIDAGLNTYAATHFSARSVNWLHACYGIGATIGPLIMTRVLDGDHPWQWGYAIVGFGQLALAMCFALTRKLWTNDGSLQKTSTSTSTRKISSRDTLRLPTVWLSIGVFFLYTGIEAAAGTWSYSLFTEGRAIPMTTAGKWVSIYWGCLTAGRLLSGFIVNFVTVHQLMRLCMIGLAIGASLTWINLTSTLSFLGLALMGLCSAPIFPLMIADTPGRLGEMHTANAVGFQIAAATFGAALLPSLVGVLVADFGLESIGPALLIAAVLLLAMHEWLLSMSKRSAQIVKNKIKLAL